MLEIKLRDKKKNALVEWTWFLLFIPNIFSLPAIEEFNFGRNLFSESDEFFVF